MPSHCRLLRCIRYSMFSEALRKKCHELRPIRVITRHITNNRNHGFVIIDQILYPIQRTKNASTIKKTMFNLHCTFIHTHTYSSTTLSFSAKKIPKQNTHLCDFKSPLSPNLSLEKKKQKILKDLLKKKHRFNFFSILLLELCIF